MPADQIEAAADFGIGTLGDDTAVAHQVAVAQQLALARANADGEIAARRNGILFPDAVAGQVIDLGPLADCAGLWLVGFPMIFGQSGDAFGQLRAHIGRDRVADRLLVEPTHQLMLVQRAVAAQVDLVDAAGSAASAFSTTRRLPDPAGTLPSRNSSATITSCSAHSAST